MLSTGFDRARQSARDAQQAWARRPMPSRLAVLRRARHLMSARTEALCAAISPDLVRTSADTRVAEILPLLDACRFLERSAASILRVRKLGRAGLPLWLTGVDSEVQRVPLGQILVLGPANYPLFLPGVQTLQALAAGNSVVWKPGRGGRGIAEIFCLAMFDAGLPPDLLTLTDDSADAGREALAGRTNGMVPDKVIFTGSVEVGRDVLRALAETLTPCVMELSGCDAVVVLPSADPGRVVKALRFGVMLNGSETCMAPRRLFLLGLSDIQRDELLRLLTTAFEGGEPALADSNGSSRSVLVTYSETTDWEQPCEEPPVLAVTEVADEASFLAADALCPYGLTLAIFGEERAARRLGAQVCVGAVLINDVIVPTADPRVPFGGRRRSGFGTTRGREGLLEMTAVKTVSVRRSNSTRHYQSAGNEHERLFDGAILASHGETWRKRWHGMKQVLSSLRALK